ncbi:MAG: hypothetical protein M0Z67_09045 [Nitrospiraceae bacterium]|nr:hypothetical protein [Nitrospiraceae bacterium]
MKTAVSRWSFSEGNPASGPGRMGPVGSLPERIRIMPRRSAQSTKRSGEVWILSVS